MNEANLKLSTATLATLPQSVERPLYNRAEITAGIVHLGVGAFHRAHQAVYTDDILQEGPPGWGIIGVSLHSPATRDALEPQDHLYTVTIRSSSQEKVRVIGSILKLLVAPESPQAVLDAMCDPHVKIVSLTITEKGYCYAFASASLDEAHADIIHDLQNPEKPRSALGYIVEALHRRREAGLMPFTLLSCDNLPDNGQTLKRVILQFASLRDKNLADYIEHNVSFPSTMVDRIVPATTDEDRAAITETIGVTDAWPIMTEAFSQWVVEDRFLSGRPAWENVGVTFVDDVSAFELMKLRLLNGSHSTMAYLGYLAGCETISDVMQTKDFERFIKEMMDQEISPTLAQLAGFDLEFYKNELIERFQNAALKHRTWQIAMDGSQKLPQRLLGTIKDRLAHGQPIDRLALGVAGWMRYARGVDEKGVVIDVRDPLKELFQARVQPYKTAPDIVAAFCSLEEIFNRELADDNRFRTTVSAALSRLLEVGAANAVAEFIPHN